ncbi:MAG: formyltetrahydrofolate deformylase [Parvularculaceae bacterium]
MLKGVKSDEFIVRLSCKDRPGIVSAVTTFLYQVGLNIVDSQQFDDRLKDRFFARILCEDSCKKIDIENLRSGFGAIAANFDMEWSIRRRSPPQRVLILASKFDHCLADLLFRWRSGELFMDPVGVVSNHSRETYERINLGEIPFHYLPVTNETKKQQEEQLKAIVEDSSADLVILARYMQILSDDMAAFLAGRCINIHHSFLPGFKGAKPYHQAHERGVKIIGATAHYVTAELDEGPIIEQDIERISHRDTPEELVRKGRDIERRVLARAVRYHLDDRVMLNGATTVVFPE